MAAGSVSRSGNLRPHVVLLPYPLQGHINPMVQFGEALASRFGFKVTFVNSRRNHERMLQQQIEQQQQQSSKADSTKPPLMELVWVEDGVRPEDGLDYSDLVPRIWDFHRATFRMKQPFKDLLLSLQGGGGTRVSCVVFGSFCPWAHDVAAELGIPSALFWTQSAFILDIYYHGRLLESKGFFPYRGCDIEGDANGNQKIVDYIPGIPPLQLTDFPTLLRIENTNAISFQSIQEQLETLKTCNFVIINSFYELEREAFDTLQRLRSNLYFYMVGPLLPSRIFKDFQKPKNTSFDSRVSKDKVDCIRWLDTQKMASVLYISFGSMAQPSIDEFKILASGVMACKQPFLWVIRENSYLKSLSDIMSESFLKETKDYGLVIPWAPQLQVLSHPSLGAFLSHCGWNSTIESISAGVPILTFPMFSDQITNSKYITDVWKVGLELKRRDNKRLTCEDVSMIVKVILEGEEGQYVRRNAWRLRDIARKVTQDQGSSYVGIQRFAEAIDTSLQTNC